MRLCMQKKIVAKRIFSGIYKALQMRPRQDMGDNTMQWEFDVLYWFQSLHSPVMDKVGLFLTMLCEKGIFWIIVTLGMFFFLKNKKPGLTAMGALCLSFLLCNLILKHIVQRDRPCWIDPSIQLLVETPDDYSFPSGHTSFSFACATAIFQYYKGWGILALLLAAGIGLSRLYLFVHFPTDVLVGACVGIIAGMLSGMLIRDFYKAYPNFRIPILEKKPEE